MILLTANTPEGPKLAAKTQQGILVLAEASKLLGANGYGVPQTLREALSNPAVLKRLETVISSVLSDDNAAKSLHRPEEEVRIAAPFTPRSIICVGLNYKDHAAEGGVKVPERPVLFAKLPSSVIGPGEPIILPPETNEVDYEAELAVVIGRRCKGVAADQALDYVAGYTSLNDVSARDFQRGDGQWVRAKSQDTFCPFGPYLVTRDEICDPQRLAIRCLVNGRALQSSNTNKMIFSVAEIIAFTSRGITLEPGDIISTGTPHGVGFARKPPVFLRDGDEVVVEVEKVGRLANPVKKIS